jgi:hypothetical protein
MLTALLHKRIDELPINYRTSFDLFDKYDWGQELHVASNPGIWVCKA